MGAGHGQAVPAPGLVGQEHGGRVGDGNRQAIPEPGLVGQEQLAESEPFSGVKAIGSNMVSPPFLFFKTYCTMYNVQ